MAEKHCQDHSRMERELGETTVELISLEKADTATASAVKDLTLRIRSLERKMFIWLGILTAIMVFPTVMNGWRPLFPAPQEHHEKVLNFDKTKAGM